LFLLKDFGETSFIIKKPNILKQRILIRIMENKNVGLLIVGISILIIIITLLFTNSLRTYVNDTCPIVHGPDPDSCPAMKTISQQTYLAIAISGIILIIGIVLFFSKPNEKIIIKKVKERKKKADLSKLQAEDKKVFKIIQENNGIFQADLIEKTEWGKTKITRILNRLEDKGLIERKRRGMTNVVVLKN
jgi:uncharacterized membrane protein